MKPRRFVFSFGTFGLACLLLAVVPACADGLGDPTGSTCPSDSALTYESFGRPFFQTNCLRCHSSIESPHFNTQAEIQANSDEIDRAAAAGPDATNTFMPEEGEVSDEDRKKLGEWLACGAP